MFEPFEHRRRRRIAVALAQPGVAQLAQVVLRLLVVRRREDGEVARLEVEFDAAAVGDLLTPFHGLLAAGEEAVHLLRRPDVELIDQLVQARFAVAHALLVGALGAGVDAQQNVMGVGVVARQVVGVAGGDQRQAEFVGDADRPVGALLLDVQAVVLDLDVKVLAEDAVEPARQLFRLVELVLEDEFAELAGGAATETNDAFLVYFQQLLVDARDVMIALHEGDGGHLDEVAKAGAVLGQEREVEAGLAAARRPLLGALAGGDVGLVADDRVEADGPAFLVKLDGAVEVAVVGEGEGVHALRLGVGRQLGEAVGAVEQAVVAVTVQMNEGTAHREESGVRGQGSAGTGQMKSTAERRYFPGRLPVIGCRPPNLDPSYSSKASGSATART